MAMLVSTLLPERPAPIDGPPADFDAATNPILARHWYGIRRALGPGERAAAQACRQRGLRVIDGGRP